jgi:hypothetical protein
VDCNRFGNVLEPLLPASFEPEWHFVASKIHYPLRDAYAPRIRCFLEAGRYVDGLAMPVLAFNDHVAHMDANAQLNALLMGRIEISFGHSALEGCRAFDGIHSAVELDEQAISHHLEYASAMMRDGRLD